MPGFGFVPIPRLLSLITCIERIQRLALEVAYRGYSLKYAHRQVRHVLTEHFPLVSRITLRIAMILPLH